MIAWHRLFGLGLTDLFTGTGYVVELEKDLSVQQQFLDCLVIERGPAAYLPNPPDGLEELGQYNVMTYKSHQEALDDFSIDELVGHFVTVRKQLALERGPLAPLECFRLFAVCTRFPEKLSTQVEMTPIKQGVFAVRWGVRQVRVIVLKEVEPAPRNALWELFSGMTERVREGAGRYRWKRDDLSTVLTLVFQEYGMEGMNVVYTVEDFKRDLAREVATSTPAEELLKWIPIEERLKGLRPEERLKGLRPEDLLKALRPEERLKGLPPEDRLKGLRPEDLLKALSREE
ncbi:MAG: hypothetical protein HYU43_07705, partial [Armatimonadetes bacterium]|nr:hypothetical protein [Armatimonadota bacterium]